MPIAARVAVAADKLRIELVGGRVVERPIRWYPIVNLAPAPARRRVRVIAGGSGIAWPILGYELGVDGIVRQRRPLKF